MSGANAAAVTEAQMDKTMIVYLFWTAAPCASLLGLWQMRDNLLTAAALMLSAICLFLGPFALASVGLL